MEQLRGMELRLSEQDRSKFLDLLSDYFHLMTNCHPFYRINNSVIMNQVNYVLRIHGLRPVAHGDMDLLATMVGYKKFREFFKEYIDRFQRS